VFPQLVLTWPICKSSGRLGSSQQCGPSNVASPHPFSRDLLCKANSQHHLSPLCPAIFFVSHFLCHLAAKVLGHYIQALLLPHLSLQRIFPPLMPPTLHPEGQGLPSRLKGKGARAPLFSTFLSHFCLGGTISMSLTHIGPFTGPTGLFFIQPPELEGWSFIIIPSVW
jgi:hypothetical protein